jgi:hypothetical protein
MLHAHKCKKTIHACCSGIKQLSQAIKKEGLTTFVTQGIIEEIKSTLSENGKSSANPKIGALMTITAMYEEFGEGAGVHSFWI